MFLANFSIFFHKKAINSRRNGMADAIYEHTSHKYNKAHTEARQRQHCRRSSVDMSNDEVPQTLRQQRMAMDKVHR